MSLIDKKNSQNILLRNNQTFINNSQSYTHRNDSLPTISFHKIPKLNKLYNRHNLNLVKSPKITNSVKNVLLSPVRNNNNIYQTSENKKDYITKIIIQNYPSVNEVIFIFENYLKNNQFESKYKLFYETNTIIFIFEEENVALDFMKLLFKEKQINRKYKYTTININLLKKEKEHSTLPEINKKIADEVLQRLYYGFGYEKKEKPVKKILGNFPFFNSISKSIKQKIKNIFNKKLKVIKKDKNINKLGYNGQPLKTNNKLKINLLNTSYKPIPKTIVRDEDKNKWMCPLDFKIY